MREHQPIHAGMAGRLLAALGGASMTIMFLHQFAQLVMAKKFGLMRSG